MIQTAAFNTTDFRLDAISFTTTDAMRRLIAVAKAKSGAAFKFAVVAVASPLISFGVMCAIGGAMNQVFN